VTLLGAPASIVVPAIATGGVVLVALYRLKLTRRRVEVPFAELWRRVIADSQSTAWWKKLKRLLSLLIQLALLLLILVAVLDPRLGASRHARSYAIVVDTSASMQATDAGGKRRRIDAAKDAARRLIAGLGGDDEAMMLAMDARPEPQGGFSRDERTLYADVDSLAANDTAADLGAALALAGDALRGRANPTLVLIGDGAWDADDLSSGARALAQAGVDLRYIPVGSSSDNVAVTTFAVRRYRANRTAYEVLVEVQSFRSVASNVTLELVQDGEVVEREKLTLQKGARLQRLYPNLAGAGQKLEARLVDAKDALPLDDVAYAVLPDKKKQRVLLVSGGDLFLEGALLLDANLDVDKVAPARYSAAAARKYGAVIFDAFTPEEAPETNALYLDPQGDKSPFLLKGSVDSPFVTETAAEHPLLRWVALRDLNIARTSTFTLQPGDVAIASSFKRPFIVARAAGGHKAVALGFDLKRSDLPLRVAFPVLIINTLDWFAGQDAGLSASYPTGRPFRHPVAGGAREVSIRAPDGTVVAAPVHDGRTGFVADRVGYYDVAGQLVAVNLADERESNIAPHPLVVGGRTLAPPQIGRLGRRRELWTYLALLALAIVFVEWWSYNRRVTV
jgi:hypothetical protein